MFRSKCERSALNSIVGHQLIFEDISPKFKIKIKYKNRFVFSKKFSTGKHTNEVHRWLDKSVHSELCAASQFNWFRMIIAK